MLVLCRAWTERAVCSGMMEIGSSGGALLGALGSSAKGWIMLHCAPAGVSGRHSAAWGVHGFNLNSILLLFTPGTGGCFYF